jgi:hypothetical protein
MYAPYVKQEEPLKTECQHFLDCIRTGSAPVSCGQRGTELVKILEASSESLRLGGAPVDFASHQQNGQSRSAGAVARGASVPSPRLVPDAAVAEKKRAPRPARKAQIKIVLNGNGQHA